ncbi:hypothetical protein GRI97_07445 [Altererythrobacter xixiisoli]|uniref:TauD/TfdA-like domain-containing protein n=1 Tax=Croceibacterium xixiisoli TaxID=1476466 RepID=A0A6I4TVK4_9SPHN|nr:TauD/TfdA family dioxygenase [Croceibacterium xixiisoli]MXO98817.1 hypothetical protein [Croceibacterium xixiisoli]
MSGAADSGAWTRVTDASAWTATGNGGAELITRRLGAAQIAALAEAVQATEALPPEEVTRAHFSAPELTQLMQAVQHDIVHGRGATLLSGISLQQFTEAEFTRIYVGLGQHLGTPAIQSPRGDKIGYVQHEPNPDNRGYLMDTELGPHTDFHEILSLATIQTAVSGGISGMTSSAAVFNAVLDERPDLLAVLTEGYYFPDGSDAEGGSGTTDYKVPIFSIVDRHVSLYNYVLFVFAAAQSRGEEVPPKLVEALRFLKQVCARPEFTISFEMQPGEMVFWHNFKVLHSRTGFQNSATQKRRLLRLWLNAHEHRPMAKGYLELARLMDHHHVRGKSLASYSTELLRDTYAALAG